MADGFKIEIEGEQAEQIKAAAQARGMSVELYVRAVLELAQDADLLDESDAGQDAADRAEINRRWKTYEKDARAIDHTEIVELLRRRAR